MKIIKTTLLIGSGLIGGGLLVLDHIGTVALCGGTTLLVPVTCIDRLYNILVMFNPFIPLFLLSLITYRMRDAVVRPWLYFTAGWIPLSMALIYLTPDPYGGGWFSMDIVTKGTVALFMSALFVIISALLVTIVWSETSATDKQKHM